MSRKRTLADVMQTEIVSLGPDDRLDLADDVMRLGRVRHMPVLDGDRLIGIVTSRDLLAASLSKVLNFDPVHRRSFMRSIEVKEAMTRNPFTLPGDATLREAAALMRRHQIGCIPVVEGAETMVGLVTETDLLQAALLGDDDDAVEASPFRVLGTRVDRELEGLRGARDELRLQVELGKAEIRDLWDRAEHGWREIEKRARRLESRVEEPVEEVREAAEKFVDEIRDAYKRIKDAL